MQYIKNSDWVMMVASVVAGVLFVTMAVNASTTISTNISTGGTLAVTGASTLTGLTTMVYASSTGQSLTGNFSVGGYATTTGANGNFATAGTLTVTGLTTLVYASSTGQSLTGNFSVGGYATTTAASGNIATRGTLTVGLNGTAIGPIIKGSCALVVQLGTVGASTTNPYDCAVTGVVSGDTVFMQFATSSPAAAYGPQWIIMGAMASTTNGYITADVYNATGLAGNPSHEGLASSTNYLILH